MLLLLTTTLSLLQRRITAAMLVPFPQHLVPFPQHLVPLPQHTVSLPLVRTPQARHALSLLATRRHCIASALVNGGKLETHPSNGGKPLTQHTVSLERVPPCSAATLPSGCTTASSCIGAFNAKCLITNPSLVGMAQSVTEGKIEANTRSTGHRCGRTCSAY
jgi:hypothetical protein